MLANSVVLLGLIAAVSAADFKRPIKPIRASYDHHGVSVELFEWSWADVAQECEDFLGPKGFKAVQVSPPNEHIQGSQWWTRYQPVTYDIISRSGDEDQFVDMINRCAKVNVDIIVDAVINHMAAGSGTGVGGTSYGNRTYRDYGQEDFHHLSSSSAANCEVNDYSDKYNVQNCDLVGLPDLNTGSTNVQNKIAAYVNKLYDLGARGVRIDAAKHQDASEMMGYVSQFPQSNFFVGTEVISGQGEAVTPDMYYELGMVSEFNYASFLDDNIVSENKMKYLETFGESWGLMPDQYAAVFLDNWDTQRSGAAQLTYKDGGIYNFANMFMLAHPYGEVRVMSSYYFSDTDQGPPSVGVSGGANCGDGKNWVCEHRWSSIANMVAWRNAAGTSAITDWTNGDNANEIAFGRGGAAFIALNRASSSSWYVNSITTGLPAGEYCNILDPTGMGLGIADDSAKCTATVTVDSSGKAGGFSVPALGGVALHINAAK